MVRDKKYLKWQSGRSCLVGVSCDRETTVAHHIYTGGMAMKCSDDETVTLCHFHHRESKEESAHELGKDKFEKKFGVDLDKEAQMLYNKYKEEKL